jgi:hypothetical protein
MSYGLHINNNPNGTFSFVGSVPESLVEWRKPTRSDVMAQRVNHETGLAFYFPVYQTVEEAIERAKAVGAQLCNRPGCACRKYFN